MTKIVSVPGIGNSGPNHWQTHWERIFPKMIRISPASWTAPELGNWVKEIDRVSGSSDMGPVFVCHSLGCLAFLHWAQQTTSSWQGALLVGVPDATGVNFPKSAAGFAPRNISVMRSPMLVLESSDDPYDPVGEGRQLAQTAGGTVINLGCKGHINEASGLGDWKEGQGILTAFLAGLAAA